VAIIGEVVSRLFSLLGAFAIESLFNKRKGAPSFLIISLRYLGDVLVTTPLAVSLKQAFPDAIVDYLVFEGTEAVLAHNPLIGNVITVPHKKSNFGTLAALFRKYDVAFGAYPSDRTAIMAACAGKRSIGLSYPGKNEWWKRIIFSDNVFCDKDHVISNILSLLRPLNIPAVPRVSIGGDESDLNYARRMMPGEPYIVLHPFSRNHYKFLPAKTWSDLARLIREQTKYRVIITRTPAAEDEAYLVDIISQSGGAAATFEEPCSINRLAAFIKGAAAYVGIDTVVTHVAAAVGAPTIALYGPSWTKYWAPWPNDCREASPFAVNRGIQRKGNVTVVQKDWECVPCNGMSCRISTRDKMECLEKLTPEEVFGAIKTVLGDSL
jgi:heptosyltransferase-3